MRSILLGAALSAAVSGAAIAQTAEAPAVDVAPAAPAIGTATVYVMRPSAFAWFHRPAQVAVDDMVAGNVGNGGCVVLTLAPGAHKISVGWPFMLLTLDDAQPPVEVMADLQPGETQFYDFDTDVSFCQGGYNQVCHDYRWRLSRMGNAPDPAKCKPLAVTATPSRLADLRNGRRMPFSRDKGNKGGAATPK